MFEKYDLGIASTDPRIIKRCNNICTEFNYKSSNFEPIESTISDQVDYRIILIAGINFPNGGEFSAYLGSLRIQYQDAFIVYVETTRIVENSTEIARKFGCNLSLVESDFFDTSKAEYIFTQVIRATYIPIKSRDIAPGKPIGFDTYHLLPQRQKFIKFCFQGDEIDQKKLDKIKAANEVYIHRSQADQFATYIADLGDNSPEGLNRRCRSQYIALYAAYTNLVLIMTDQSEKGTFENGEELLKKCRDIAMSLQTTLATHPNPWEIINQATIGDFGSLERATAVSAYSGILGIALNLKLIEDIMLAPLISELGILYLPRQITEHLRKDTLHELTVEETHEYSTYPIKSIAVVLDRKAQMDEQLRAIILSAHEKADKTGFPGKKFGKHIPIESFVVHFAFELDRLTAVRLGKPLLSLENAIKQLLDKESEKPSHFTLEFTLKMKLALKPKNTPQH